MSDVLQDGEFSLEPTSGSAEVSGFAVLRDGDRLGTVALALLPRRRAEPITASLRWQLPEGVSVSQTARVLALAITHAFGELGVHRVEARVVADDHALVRAASMAGMRREGVARGPVDHVQLARLADDPPARTSEGFIAMLNAGLPRKRAIAQGLLRDEQGRILLCELTYKTEWDLPGGVIEVGESPATGLAREIEEELGVSVEVGDLVTVSWLPPWRGWDDACLFVFDLGTAESSLRDTMTLQQTEIRAVHWCDPEAVRARATAATVELLNAIGEGAVPPPTYREASHLP